jgi:hypothetical protein
LGSLEVRRSSVVTGLCSIAVALGLAVAPAGAVVAKIGGRGYGITPIDSAAEESLLAANEAQHGSGPAARPLAKRYDVPPLGGTQLVDEGGPVMHSATTHVIYWDPNEQFRGATRTIVDGFFVNVAHDSGLPTNTFAIAGQYTDATGHAAYSSTATTSLLDTEKFPSSGCTAPAGGDPGPPYTECLEDAQLQAELTRFVAAEKLPVGPTQLYFILLPHTVATCLDEEAEVAPGVKEQACSNNVFCAYHSYIEPGTPREIVYADIPFSLLDAEEAIGVPDAKGCQDDGHDANIQQPNPDNGAGEDSQTRFSDVALKYISHEYIEAVTDPLVNFETAWVDSQRLEIADKCNGVDGPASGVGNDPNAFLPVLGGTIAGNDLFDQAIGTGHYYLQSEWDNADRACLMAPLPLGAGAFSPPSGVAGSPVSFSGSASDPYAGFEPTWTFGDGSIGVGAAPTHVYAAAGVYTVTMLPKDKLTGSTGPEASHTVTIAAAPSGASATSATPPAPPPLARSSDFAPLKGSFDAKTGALTFTTTVANPGTFSWLATFQNGRFGAFASASSCKRGSLRLGGRCRPARIVFAKGSRLVAAPGNLTVTLKPSASALKALKNALKRNKGLPILIAFSFKSSLGGSAVTRSPSLTVKLRR